MSPDKDDDPTQRTEQGLEIPIPDRDDVFAAFSKVARPDHNEDDAEGDSDE